MCIIKLIRQLKKLIYIYVLLLSLLSFFSKRNMIYKENFYYKKECFPFFFLIFFIYLFTVINKNKLIKYF